MKIHMPTRLYHAVLSSLSAVAILSAASITPASANEINYSHGDVTFTTQQKGNVSLSDYHSVTYKEIEVSGSSICDGGAIFSGAVSLTGNGKLSFSGNFANAYEEAYASDDFEHGPHAFSDARGGAIFDGATTSAIRLTGNEILDFSGNYAISHAVSTGCNIEASAYAHGEGGAIRAMDSSVDISANGTVSFNGNFVSSSSSASASRDDLFSVTGEHSETTYAMSISEGGAIYAYYSSTISMTDNREVEFIGNYAATEANASSSISPSDAYTITKSAGGAMYVFCSSVVNLYRSDSVLFSENTAEQGGAIYAYWKDSAIHFSDNGSVAMCGNSAAYGGAIYADSGSIIDLSNNESVVFSGNSAAYGGAIYAATESTINLANNGSITFSGNDSSSENANVAGAAIYNAGSFEFAGNKAVSFLDNAAHSSRYAYGSAVYNTGVLTFAGNESVLIEGNHSESSSSGSGGMPYGAFANIGGSVHITRSQSVKYADNSIGVEESSLDCGAYGGALANDESGRAVITGCTEVSFLNNNVRASWLSAEGGAIFNRYSSQLSLMDNGTVSFAGNSSHSETYHGRGGAIINFRSSTASISGNEMVMFQGNVAEGASSSFGGAVFNSASTLNLENNKQVCFTGNRVESWSSESQGGAVFNESGGTLNIRGNGEVVFRNNVEVSSSGYHLRSVYSTGANLNLAAEEGKSITFYDSIYTSHAINLNQSYEDGEGALHRCGGDITFSGKYTENDLMAYKSDFTHLEWENSLTSEVYAATNLYGGRLRIEDGAIYKGHGINVAAESNATLRLSDSTLDQTGYSVVLNDTTTLDLAGVNSITASSLQMLDGSTLSFNVGAAEGALLNLDAVLTTGSINVNLSGDLTKEHALLQLADVSQYDLSRWNSGQVSVSGTDFEHLVWSDGVLSYKPWESTHTDVKEDTEVDDFGGEEGVDIDGGGHSLTVKHPVDLVQLAMKDGVVRLEGENNNVVRITLTEDGTLELAAGAGLKVGNIVSMVANGSADLVISGDIEISDIKAYGKPGNKGTLSYVEMKTEGDYTIENMNLSGSLIDIGEGTTMYMVNVDIKPDTRITDDAAWLDMVATQAWLTKDNTVATGRYTTDANTTLYLCGDTAKSITLAAGTDIVELTSAMFDTVTLTGTDLWLDMTKIAGLMPNTDYITLQFKNLENALVDVENLKVYATIDGETYRQAYAMTDHGTTTTLYFALPEPATSTLSLLALAALAARRRRK